jgi:hypothetical protein
MALFNQISENFVLTGPKLAKTTVLPSEQTEPFVCHLVKHLQVQLAERGDLSKQSWLINYLTKETIQFGQVLDKVKRLAAKLGVIMIFNHWTKNEIY